MADRDISVLTPATSQDLLTLDECKTLLSISLGDTSRDAQLQMQISIASTAVADMANRKPELGFGQTTVLETWRETGNGRLFLMHWPVKVPNGIIQVTAGGVVLSSSDYTVDVNSGKMSMPTGGTWASPTVVQYTGGWTLPASAPKPLKWACAMMVQEQRIRNQQAQTAGIRLLAHKESRIAFYDPNAILIRQAGAKSTSIQIAEILVRPYMRLEV